MLLLMVLTTVGAWGQTTVITEDDLLSAITDSATIKLGSDIQLNRYLDIESKTVTIDLNGHRLYRVLASSASDGHIFWVHEKGRLTIVDSSDAHSGTIEGGKANNGGGINVWDGCSLTVNGVTFKNNRAGDNGGAIFVQNGAVVTVSNATFIGNSARDHGGAVWNNGTFTATNCTFTDNTANDVGGVYNSVTAEGAGKSTFTGCFFTGNVGTNGAGALANAVGVTVMTLDSCTVTGNIAGTNGGGIWNGGTLNMKGVVTVTGNTIVSGLAHNVFLKQGKVITVTGNLAGSSIGILREDQEGDITSGYSTSGGDLATVFLADNPVLEVTLSDGNEARLTKKTDGDVYYIERSWDSNNNTVTAQFKTLPRGSYITLNGDDDESIDLGPGYYVVKGDVQYDHIVMVGDGKHHLILCDGAQLKVNYINVAGRNTLYIYGQMDDTGLLYIYPFEDDEQVGIGSGEEQACGGIYIHVGNFRIWGG